MKLEFRSKDMDETFCFEILNSRESFNQCKVERLYNTYCQTSVKLIKVSLIFSTLILNETFTLFNNFKFTLLLTFSNKYSDFQIHTIFKETSIMISLPIIEKKQIINNLLF